jgi:hypothetical protein
VIAAIQSGGHGFPTAIGTGRALMARPDLADTQILRFTRPAMARRWLCLCSTTDGI